MPAISTKRFVLAAVRNAYFRSYKMQWELYLGISQNTSVSSVAAYRAYDCLPFYYHNSLRFKFPLPTTSGHFFGLAGKIDKRKRLWSVGKVLQ